MKRALAHLALLAAMFHAQAVSAAGGTDHLRGTASWYAYIPGHAAAGPALRRMLGPSWRGKIVRVCNDARCVRVRLSDWCQCYKGTSRERIVDLDVRSFAILFPPARGLGKVTVTP